LLEIVAGTEQGITISVNEEISSISIFNNIKFFVYE
jgi:hypothetical protein